MVNLLSRRPRPEPFPELGVRTWNSMVSRLQSCVEFSRRAPRLRFQVDAEVLRGELDELESAPSLASASSLVEVLEQIRRERQSELESTDDADSRSWADASEAIWAGSLLCYFPGRALSTGESEVASRGYFDVLDRPPLWSWVGVAGRPSGGVARDFEVGILAWVAQQDLDLARAGCRASAAPSVMLIEEASAPIAAQWQGECARRRGEA